MSEPTSIMGDLRADFVERNTALFLLLGLLSSTGRLTRALAIERQRFAAPPGRDEPTRFHYLLLGLVALGDKVSLIAQLGKDTSQVASPLVAEDAPRDILR